MTPYASMSRIALNRESDKEHRDRIPAEGRRLPHLNPLNYFEAVPKSRPLTPDQAYPCPTIDLRTARQRALEAFKTHRNG